jgi:hypothetical protein
VSIDDREFDYIIDKYDGGRLPVRICAPEGTVVNVKMF